MLLDLTSVDSGFPTSDSALVHFPGAYGPTDRFSLCKHTPTVQLECLPCHQHCSARDRRVKWSSWHPHQTSLLPESEHETVNTTKHQNPNQQKSSHKDLCGDRDLRSSESSSSKPAKKEGCDLTLHHPLADSDTPLSNELSKGCPIQSSPQELQEVGKMKLLLVKSR